MHRDSNFKDIIHKTQLEKRQRLDKALQKSTSYQDWKEIIIYILKNQKMENQFDLLNHYLPLMDSINYEFLDRVCYYIDIHLNYSESFPSTLILIKYILKYGASQSIKYCSKGFKEAVEKYGMLQEQVKSFQNVNPKYPKFLRYFELAIEMLPIIYTRCKITFNPKYVPVVLDWVSIIPSDSVDTIINLGKFCQFLMNKVTKQQTVESTRIEATANLLVNIIESHTKRFINRNNLSFVIEPIPEAFIGQSIKQYRTKFLSINLSVYIDFWKSLLELGASESLIGFILQISNLYKNHGKVKQLFQIYENIVSDVIFKDIKFSRTAQTQIQKLTIFFIDNLLTNIRNKEVSIINILQDYDRLDSQYKGFWGKTIMKLIRAAQDQKIEIKFKETCEFFKIPPLDEQEYSKLKSSQSEIKNSMPVNGSQDIQNSRRIVSVQYSIIPLTKENKKKSQNIQNISTVFNILYNTERVPKLFTKYSDMIRKQVKKILSISSQIFKMMSQNLSQETFGLIQQIQKLNRHSYKSLTLQEWMQFVKEQIALGLQFDQNIHEAFSEIFRIQLSLKITCNSCKPSNAKLISLPQIDSQYGQNIKLQQNIQKKCESCRKQFKSQASLLVLPDMIQINYEPMKEKNPKPFEILRVFGEHHLVLVQFRTIQNKQIHIFWRKIKDLKVWAYYDGQRTILIDVKECSEIVWCRFRDDFLPETVIYERINDSV